MSSRKGTQNQNAARHTEEGPSVGPSFFYEDEVFRIKGGEIQFGMVTENWDMYSDDDDSDNDSETEGDPEKVPNGCVAVTWMPTSKDEIIAENKVQLSDRSLMPGDVVRRLVAGKDTQRGYCRNVRVIADVQVLGTQKIVTGINANDIVQIQKFHPEVAVYMDSWIGVIREAKYKVKLKLTDGSVCSVGSDILMDYFEEIKGNSSYSASDIFYPGQRLRGRMKYLKEADFVTPPDDSKKSVRSQKVVTGVVSGVQPAYVSVQWQWQTPAVGEFKLPPEVITGENVEKLKCLNLFESCTVQISDISYYTPTANDVVMDKAEWNKKMIASFCTNSSGPSPKGSKTKQDSTEVKDAEAEGGCKEEDNPADDGNLPAITTSDVSQNNVKNTKKFLPKLCTKSLKKKKLKGARRKPVFPKLEPDVCSVVETLHTYSLADIVWQDGTCEEGVRSTDLYPIHHLDEKEFFPGDFVVLADTRDYKKYGVIQSMDHCGRVALVNWFETYSFNGEQKPKLLEETEMSVYDIKDHPDFRFRPGTIVIRVANCVANQCPAGQILDNYPDGQSRIWWADGAITPCWPQDLFRLGEYDSDEEAWGDEEADPHCDSDDGEDEGGNTDSSWETESEDEHAHDANRKEQKERYTHIAQLIEKIQTTLVGTREAIIASSNVTVKENAEGGSSVENPGGQVTTVGNFDVRSLTKKLLIIYKDCQYLDKIMGTKFFDVEDLRKWRRSAENSSSVTANRARKISDQISRMFESRDAENASSSPSPTVAASAEPDELVNDPLNPDNSVLPDLCNIVLKKLVEAHAEYERRYGKFAAKTEEGKEETKESESTTDLTEEEKEGNGDEPEVALAMKDSQDTLAGQEVEEGQRLAESMPKSSNFSVAERVPDTHRYRLTSFLPQNQRQFLKSVQKETALLRDGLPAGIYVKSFEDRIDLFTVMIEGPEKTPYEDGLFIFDINLPPSYPSVPPMVHYLAFCTDRLNPNLYEEGKVCVSLLGTWNGRGTEVWTASSSLLQLLVSIQGLILNQEPYFNEAGYEKQKGTQQGAENSRMYNENVLIKLAQSMSRMLANPPAPWETEIKQYIKNHGPRMVERYTRWLKLSEDGELPSDELSSPPFPLFPVSKGFQITLGKIISSFSKLLSSSAL